MVNSPSPSPKIKRTPDRKPTPFANSANSTPTRSDTERRSFQGDHHRHRYMSYSATSSPIRSSPHSNQFIVKRPPRPSPKNFTSPDQNHPSSRQHSQSRSERQQPFKQEQDQEPKPPPQQHPSTTLSVHQQHLGAPTNAHYSPHYGSAVQRVTTGKRKPPPPLTGHHSASDTSPILRSLSPQTPSPRSADPSPSRSRTSTGRLSKSRSPSPSPRSGGLARKIGSVLSAPFKSSSRRGSDASDIGSGIHDSHRMGATSFPGMIAMPLTSSSGGGSAEYLPSMPSVGGHHQPASQAPLTMAQQIIKETRSREAMSIVPESPERVLRVVNGLASTSTRASTESRTDLTHVFSQPSIDGTQMAASARTKTAARLSLDSAYCSKCRELEHKLALETDRSRALERALEEQTHKLDQLRTWSTAKIATLDQALRSQEKLLQDVERRLNERRQPDIKSDYLIALQKDFVELNARLAVLEGKPPSDASDSSPMHPMFAEGPTSHDAGEDDTQSPSTQPTSFGRTTPVVSPEAGHFMRRTPLCASERAYSTPPLMVSTQRPGAGTARKWNPSSPANMAAKLMAPGESPGTAARSAPATPTSRSPRPRYTSALGLKAASPLGFASAERLARGSHPPERMPRGSYAPERIARGSHPPERISHGSLGPERLDRGSPTPGRPRAPLEALSQPPQPGFSPSARPSAALHKRLGSLAAPAAGPTSPLLRGRIPKPAVGDLIKMFDRS